MAKRGLLYSGFVDINDKISINIPMLRDVIDNEDEYFGIVSMLTATPYDMMVQLDDAGIDFSTIDDYDLFIITFDALKAMDTSLVFGGLDFSGFQLMKNELNGAMVMRDEQNDITIDRAVYVAISDTIRKIHHLKRENKKPANKAARDYMIERARKKLKRKSKKKSESAIESLIVALVNTEQFSYTYESVLDVTIYQFYESVHQIMWKIDYDNKMHGIYSGTIDAKDIRSEELNWLSHK